MATSKVAQKRVELEENELSFFWLLLRTLKIRDAADLAETLVQRGVWESRAKRLSRIYQNLLDEGKYVKRLEDGDEPFVESPEKEHTLATKIQRYWNYPHDER